MKKIALLPLILITLLSACVETSKEYPSKDSQIALSSVRDLPITFPKGSTFALSPKYLEEMSISEEENKKVYHIYANTIIDDFLAQGYKLAGVEHKADFYVGFGLALVSDFTDAQMNEKLGLSPGLANNKGNTKGSFVIYVDEAIEERRVWRGSAQGYVQKDADDEARKSRATYVVTLLLAQYHK
jgi:hypothetical protein